MHIAECAHADTQVENHGGEMTFKTPMAEYVDAAVQVEKLKVR